MSIILVNIDYCCHDNSDISDMEIVNVKGGFVLLA